MSAPYIFIKKGEILFQEGSQSDCAYIINSGRLEVSKGCGKEEKEVLGFLENNDIVGEMGLIDGQPRSATVTASKNTRLSKITKDQFDSLFEHNPKALMPIMKVMVKRMRETLHLVKGLRKQNTKTVIIPADSL